MKQYALDANVFIEPQKRYFPRDLCPDYWRYLEDGFAAGKFISIRDVYDELQEIDDAVSEWASDLEENFIELSQEEFSRASLLYKELRRQRVAGERQYSDQQINHFNRGADLNLVAFAWVRGCVIVTEEVRSGGKKLKIPNVASRQGVQTMNLFEMLHSDSVRIQFR